MAQSRTNELSQNVEYTIIDEVSSINCKLIYEQDCCQLDNENSINIRHTLISKGDNPYLLSVNSKRTKVKLQLEMDTCYFVEFKKDSTNFRGFLSSQSNMKVNDSWKIIIDKVGMKCMDTNYHNATIFQGKDSIMLNKLFNVKILEFDIDEDSKTEIYLFSYVTCESKLKIYRIMRRQ
ncbi:hypothetical protein [Labilibacter marinus]|uniref:hypothetical protein n=1 Tax=Labilibacter marinus TaxID=1477105 RepID=UPI001179E341|nr:hypothetical protein [Labilibacter marinus]